MTGILLVAPLLYMWWQSAERPRRALVWLSLTPVPLLAFLAYLDAHGFGALAPITGEAAYGRSMTGPLGTLWQALRVTVLAPGQDNLPRLIVVAISLAALVQCWRRLPRAYSIYATLALIVVLWSPAHSAPLQSVDRYTLTIFPLWMVAAAWIREHRLLVWTIALEVVGLAYYTSQFATWWFVA